MTRNYCVTIGPTAPDARHPVYEVTTAIAELPGGGSITVDVTVRGRGYRSGRAVAGAGRTGLGREAVVTHTIGKPKPGQAVTWMRASAARQRGLEVPAGAR
jgi:hypothetical protein